LFSFLTFSLGSFPSPAAFQLAFFFLVFKSPELGHYQNLNTKKKSKQTYYNLLLVMNSISLLGL
jgi:hypothetical protein